MSEQKNELLGSFLGLVETALSNARVFPDDYLKRVEIALKIAETVQNHSEYGDGIIFPNGETVMFSGWKGKRPVHYGGSK